jgi:hypothetical protein
MKTTGRLVAVTDLSLRDIGEMFALMERHYDNVCRHAFDADLADKRWVIEIRSEANGELCGFSTQMLLDAEVEGRAVKSLFSGDTIIDPRHWGDRALLYVGGRLSLSLIDEFPDAELYWFLISAGYKTYRFLPVFFHQFYPRYDQPMPQAIRQVIATFSQQKFPDRYDLAAGVIRAHADQYRLREGVADVTPERRRDPHVQFFVERNPGHVVGDELCCIAPLSRANFTEAAYRVLGVER